MSPPARTPATMVCPVCDTGKTVRDDVLFPHCPDCGSLLRAAPQQWGVGEIGLDTADTLLAAIESDEFEAVS